MPYPSDLTDAQWALIESDIIRKKRRGPKSKANMRSVVNAILLRLRTGCQWQYLPLEYERFEVVKGYWRRWKESGLWQKLNDKLRRLLREKAGKSPEPTAAIIDSQSVKTAQKGAPEGMMQAKKSRVANAISPSTRLVY
jgi:putative transposase